jgi:prophage DNA circulation protein
MEPVVETQAQITAQIVATAVRETAAAVAAAVRETAIAAATVKENESGTALTAIEVLKTKMNAFETQMAELKNTFKDINDQLDEINKGRPSWAVTVILSILSTLCGSLIVYSVLR